MRRAAYLLVLQVGCTSLASPSAAEEIVGQRQGTTSAYHVQGFDAVATGTAGRVEVRVGPTWSVRATGPAAAIAQLRVERDGSVLRLLPRDRRGSARNDLDRHIRVLVTMPRLVRASVGGAGAMTVDRVTGSYLRASVGGSGSLALDSVAVEELALSVAGSGGVTAAGRADRLKVSAAGSGDLVAPGLQAAAATVAVAGSGGVRAVVNGSAAVSVAGSGHVDLGARARCSVKRAGSGRVICGA